MTASLRSVGWSRWARSLWGSFFILGLCVLALGGCAEESEVVGAGSSLAPSGTSDAGGRVADSAAGPDASSDLGTEPTPSTLVKVKNPASGSRVELRGSVLADGQVEVRVWLRSFTDLYGLAAHLRYDPKKLKLKYVLGEKILSGGGFEGRSVMRESPPGRLLMGGARFRVQTKPWDSPQGGAAEEMLWATLRFTVLQAGQHEVAFDPAHSFAKDGKYQDVPTAWGSLTVIKVEGGRS